MQTVLIVIHLLIVVALIATVLLQRSEGGALGMGGGGGGGGSFFSGRGQANALTRATAILGTLFFATSLLLTIVATYNRSQKSIFEQPAAVSTAPSTSADKDKPADSKATVLDKLKQIEKSAPGSAEQAPPRAQ